MRFPFDSWDTDETPKPEVLPPAQLLSAQPLNPPTLYPPMPFEELERLKATIVRIQTSDTACFTKVVRLLKAAVPAFDGEVDLGELDPANLWHLHQITRSAKSQPPRSKHNPKPRVRAIVGGSEPSAAAVQEGQISHTVEATGRAVSEAGASGLRSSEVGASGERNQSAIRSQSERNQIATGSAAGSAAGIDLDLLRGLCHDDDDESISDSDSGDEQVSGAKLCRVVACSVWHRCTLEPPLSLNRARVARPPRLECLTLLLWTAGRRGCSTIRPTWQCELSPMSSHLQACCKRSTCSASCKLALAKQERVRHSVLLVLIL